MKKNSQIHFRIDTKSHEKIKKEAEELGIGMAELCRKKICETSRLEKIERILEEILKDENK